MRASLSRFAQRGFLRPVSPCVALCAICCGKSGKLPDKAFRAVSGVFRGFVEPCQNLRCIKQRVPAGTLSAYYELPDIKNHHKRRVKKII